MRPNLVCFNILWNTQINECKCRLKTRHCHCHHPLWNLMFLIQFNFIHLYSVINNSHWNQRSLQSSRPGPTETKTLVWECSSSVEFIDNLQPLVYYRHLLDWGVNTFVDLKNDKWKCYYLGSETQLFTPIKKKKEECFVLPSLCLLPVVLGHRNYFSPPHLTQLLSGRHDSFKRYRVLGHVVSKWS